MSNTSVLKYFGGSTLLACAALACGAQRFLDYPVRQPSNYKISAQQGDVSIALEPVESVDDQQTYFHTVLTPSGFLPVLVVVRNRSKSDSLLLDKQSISYGFGETDKAAPRENSAGQKAVIASTGFVPFIGPFLASGLAKDASQIKQNLMLRELQSGTISPDTTVHGFLYVPVPKKGPRPKIHIQFPIAWTNSNTTSVLPIEF